MTIKKLLNDPCIQAGVLVGLFIVVDKLWLQSKHSTRLVDKFVNLIFKDIEYEKETAD